MSMKIVKAELEIVCGVSSAVPKTDKPEYAFAGRSNVGKSSLINALLNRKNLARTSSQPGKTQTLNFYNVNDAFYLVDLPGYAKAGREESAKWGRMVERYLNSSASLKRVFLLVDIRHEPTANDKLMYDWVVDSGYTPVVIATKLDKIKRSQIEKQKKLVRQTLGMGSEDTLIAFSSETKQGSEEIYALLSE